MNLVKGASGAGGRGRGQQMEQYSSGFGAPTSMGDSSEDEEDVGKDPNKHDKPLNYDSDEKEEGEDGSSELISLDNNSTTKNRKKVPRLAKPSN